MCQAPYQMIYKNKSFPISPAILTRTLICLIKFVEIGFCLHNNIYIFLLKWNATDI